MSNARKTQDSKQPLKEMTSQAGEFAKNIWLAGLGAYGRAFDEAQERYEQASKETPKLFNELVKKGSKLEEQARSRINGASARSRVVSLEERLNKVRGSLGFGGASTEDVQRLEKKIDALTRKVDALAKSTGGKAPAAKKPAAKRATAE